MNSKQKPVPLADISNHCQPLLLEKPIAIKAIYLLPDNAPASIQFKERCYQIISATRTKEINTDFLGYDNNEAPEARDYFKVQDQLGRWFWIYHDLKSEAWFVHGIWG
jgi:hypothetical protein